MMILTFHAPTRPLSINESNKMHWAERRRRLDPWRMAVRAAWRVADADERESVFGRPVHIQVTIPFQRAGRRDPSNYGGGTMTKAIVDELVLCGLVPDDTEEWVSVAEPKLVVGDRMVEIHITPRGRA
jgi:hypothetical protein